MSWLPSSEYKKNQPAANCRTARNRYALRRATDLNCHQPFACEHGGTIELCVQRASHYDNGQWWWGIIGNRANWVKLDFLTERIFQRYDAPMFLLQ
ncbi:MAG TPA: hypothetical protein VGJ15_12090 [Pirellulales bacterium]|jgi:hypothetical protein